MKKGRHRRFEEARKLKQSGPEAFDLGFGERPHDSEDEEACEECESIFKMSKNELTTRYHFGCQQALLNSNFLRTGSRDCLTALFLYLVRTV